MTVCTLRQALQLATLGTLMSLAACGGGGDDAAPTPAPPPAPAPGPAPSPTPAPPAGSNDPKEVAGFWSGSVDAQTTASSVYLPDGQTWTVFQTASTGAVTSVARGTATVAFPAFSVSGKRYGFGATAGSTPYSLAGTVVPKTTLSLPASGGNAATTWTYNAAYETAAKASDITGKWVASFGGGVVKLTLDVTDSGTFTGDTTGCRYTGSLVPHPAQIAVYRLSMSESCTPATGAPTSSNYVGIATLDAAKKTLSAAFTTQDGTAAGAFAAVR